LYAIQLEAVRNPLGSIYIREGFFMLTQANLIKFSLELRKKYPVIQNLSLILNQCPETNVQYIELVFIKIKKSQQHKGYGSIVLSAIVRLADEQQMQIRLTPAAMYGTDIRVLYSFYTKNGFTHMDDKTMIYFPKKPR
jgi:GNAT superfamily N-acetyltransferase